MGCVNSKAAKRPSKGTSWDKVVCRRLTIQIGRSIRTSEGGYVAAIFAANCGIVENHTPAKALENCKSSPKPSEKGSYPQQKASAEKSSGKTVLGIPILSTDRESSVLAAQKSTEPTNDDLETVNILELMEGLAEAEVSATFDPLHAHPEPLMPLTRAEDGRDSLPHKPTDDALTQQSSSCKLAARRSRPRSFSSFKSVEDVDRALSARRGQSPPPSNSPSKAWPVDDEHREKSSGENLHSPDISLQNGTGLGDTNADVNRLTCETNSNTVGTTASPTDGKAARSPDNLQRALSFKYMFNDNSSKKLDFLSSDSNPAASQIKERNAIVRGGDGLVVATARLWGEGDCANAVSSPQFSPAVSLKDWLPSTNHPSKCPLIKSGAEPSILDAFQSFQPHRPEQWSAPHCATDGTKVQPMYPQGVSSHYEEETTDEAPVFDPEMLDSFENVMKNLSKDEWDALRGMEDSPQNFLRLVKALKKSSSNSMRNREAFNKDQYEPAEPLDMKLKRLSVEKKLAFMRQNSLEIKKALAKGTMKLTQGRASVVFYSSTTRANAKVYEDCNQVRNILQSLVGVSYEERSISELLEHEQELSYVLNVSAVIVPTIYVKGKYLVGVDSIMQLYKKGLLGSMLQEAVPFGSKTSMQCICRGGKFLSCPFCKGRRKVSSVGEGTLLCRYCSGTGLITCISCSST